MCLKNVKVIQVLGIGFDPLPQSRTEIIVGPLATTYNTLRGRKCSMAYTFFNVPKCLALLGGNYMPLSKRFHYLIKSCWLIALVVAELRWEWGTLGNAPGTLEVTQTASPFLWALPMVRGSKCSLNQDLPLLHVTVETSSRVVAALQTCHRQSPVVVSNRNSRNPGVLPFAIWPVQCKQESSFVTESCLISPSLRFPIDVSCW